MGDARAYSGRAVRRPRERLRGRSATAVSPPARPPASPIEQLRSLGPHRPGRPSAHGPRPGFASGCMAFATSSCSGSPAPARHRGVLHQIRLAIEHLREARIHDLAQVTLQRRRASGLRVHLSGRDVRPAPGRPGVFGIALGKVWQEVEGFSRSPSQRDLRDPHRAPWGRVGRSSRRAGRLTPAPVPRIPPRPRHGVPSRCRWVG